MLAKSPVPVGLVPCSRSLLLLVAVLSPTLAGCDRERSDAVDAETASIAPDSVETGLPARDFKSVAAKVVQQSAGVGENDIVVLFGSDEDLPLLEDMAIEVRKLGGHPLVSATSLGLDRRSYDEVPAKYDSRTPRFALKLAEIADVFISTESGEGRRMKGVPPERMAARGEAFQPVMTLMQKRKLRSVALGNGLYPSAERAEQFGVTREELADMMYGGVDADYSQIQATGERLRKVLAGGKELRITNPSGTDLRVQIAGRPIVVSDGVISPEDRKRGGPAVSVWLPAGEVFLTPVPGTANGVIVADRLFYQGDRVEGLRLELKAGRMVGMTAKSGLQALEKYYAVAGPGKDLFSVVDIGINPGIEVPEGGAVNVWARAGAVTAVVGDNTWAGGDNRVNFSINPEIANATLEVDGTVLVKDGKLVEPSEVAGR
jgi:aminopeptidase